MCMLEKRESPTDSYESGGHVHIVALEDGQIAFRMGAYDVGFIGAYDSLLNLQFRDQEENTVMQLYKGGVSFPGNLVVSGTKSREIETEDFGKVLMHAYETPTPYFGDIGEGVIGEDGMAWIELDPVFVETIENQNYQVFLQAYGEGGCYVSKRMPSYFIVSGIPGLAFGWELKAKQKDYDQQRFSQRFEETGAGDINYTTEADAIPLSEDYGVAASEYISKTEEERIL